MDQQGDIQRATPEEHAALSTGGFAGAAMSVGKLVGLMLAGAALPLLFINAPEPKFRASTGLTIASADQAVVQQAIDMLRDKAVLDNVIRALNLTQDSNFAVNRPTASGVVSDIVSGRSITVLEAETALRERLAQAITTQYDPSRRLLAIGVDAGSAGDALRIATMLGSAFPTVLAQTSRTAPDPAIEGLHGALERAQAALDGFEAQTGEARLAILRQARTQAETNTHSLEATRQELATLKPKLEAATSLTVADILDKALPDSVEFTGLDYQRRRYVDARLVVEQLSSSLGPRHPRFLAAQAAVQDAESGIRSALSQLSASLRQQQTQVAARIAELQAAIDKPAEGGEIAADAGRLAALEAEVAEANRNYLEGESRTQAGDRPSAATATVSARARAVPVASATLPRWIPSVAGGLAGLAIGLALMLAAYRRRLKQEDEIADLARPDMLGLETLSHDEQALDDMLETVDLTDDLAVPPVLEAGDAKDFVVDDVLIEELLVKQQLEAVALSPADADAAATDAQISISAASQMDEDDLALPQLVYAEPANDRRPLADYMREALLAHKRPAAEAGLPPLVAAAMTRTDEQDDVEYRPRQGAPRADLRDLQQELLDLRERLEARAARRQAGGR
jgi:uncharacterized protein involved in exopolysaccharide biosynthesis